jgi:Mg2+ and Co2+ transporter CorA
MPSTRKNISDTVREITRKAVSSGKVDRAAVRRVTGEVRRNLMVFERMLARDLRAATRAGKDAASQSLDATLASSAMAARAASGMLAGIADSLAGQKPRRRR